MNSAAYEHLPEKAKKRIVSIYSAVLTLRAAGRLEHTHTNTHSAGDAHSRHYVNSVMFPK